MVGDTRLPRVHVGAAELLGGDVLSRCRLHERRAADEDRSRAADDHRFVRHRRHVRAAGGARAHHDRDLRDPFRRHLRLVEEDPAEVVAVGEDLVLQRQERAAGVDEVDARQPVLLGDLLRTQMLLDREREVRAPFDRRVVGDDHALAALDHADPGDDARCRSLAVVEIPRGESIQLEESAARIDESVDSLPRGELAPGAVALGRLVAAAARDLARPRAKLGDQASPFAHAAARRSRPVRRLTG